MLQFLMLHLMLLENLLMTQQGDQVDKSIGQNSPMKVENGWKGFFSLNNLENTRMLESRDTKVARMDVSNALFLLQHFKKVHCLFYSHCQIHRHGWKMSGKSLTKSLKLINIYYWINLMPTYKLNQTSSTVYKSITI